MAGRINLALGVKGNKREYDPGVIDLSRAQYAELRDGMVLLHGLGENKFDYRLVGDDGETREWLSEYVSRDGSISATHELCTYPFGLDGQMYSVVRAIRVGRE